jgi:hypothetical protein
MQPFYEAVARARHTAGSTDSNKAAANNTPDVERKNSVTGGMPADAATARGLAGGWPVVMEEFGARPSSDSWLPCGAVAGG